MVPKVEENNSFIVLGSMERCLHEDKYEMKVVDEEIDEIINLSFLIVLTHTPPKDLFYYGHQLHHHMSSMS